MYNRWTSALNNTSFSSSDTCYFIGGDKEWDVYNCKDRRNCFSAT